MGRRDPVIAGLGITAMGKIYGPSAQEFAIQAMRQAVADAGLEVDDIDGLITSAGVTEGVTLDIQRDLNIHHLRLVTEMNAHGTTAIQQIQFASMAVQAGAADVVACVFADNPLQEETSSEDAYAEAMSKLPGWQGILSASGALSANYLYAIAARRHMLTYGTTNDHFGAIAVAQRKWANLNPDAQMAHRTMTIDDYHASRWIAEPFHLFDCCLVSNGGVAVIVTTAERAESLRKPAIHILGWAQDHPGYMLQRNEDFGLRTGAVRSGPAALGMAGVELSDIDLVQLYDCYTYVVLVTLEDYGFCEKGSGGDLVASGAIAPGGSIPVNTGGGQLSGFYMWGMTPLAEAVIQLRGEAGERQVSNHELAMVSGNGGLMDHHGTLVLGAHRA